MYLVWTLLGIVFFLRSLYSKFSPDPVTHVVPLYIRVYTCKALDESAGLRAELEGIKVQVAALDKVTMEKAALEDQMHVLKTSLDDQVYFSPCTHLAGAAARAWRGPSVLYLFVRAFACSVVSGALLSHTRVGTVFRIYSLASTCIHWHIRVR